MIKELMPIAKTILAEKFIELFGRRGRNRDVYAATAMVEHNAIPEAICDLLKTRIDELIADGECHHVWCDSVGADVRIYRFERYISAELLSYFHIEESLKSIKDYLGIGAPYWFLMANRISAVPGNLGSGGGLHRDSPYSHQLKHIWYLTNVGPDNGPFTYLPGSHRNLFRVRNVFPLGQTRYASAPAELCAVTAPKGSRLVCDTKCIHGGAPIREGKRYAVTLYSFPTRNRAKQVFDKLGFRYE